MSEIRHVGKRKVYVYWKRHVEERTCLKEGVPGREGIRILEKDMPKEGMPERRYV